MPRKTSAKAPEVQALRIARDKLGFDELRAGQDEALASLLTGQDTLAVQPTGSGKSAIYLISGLMINGPTIIVSPLIALQKDQIDAIQNKAIAEAGVVNSAVRTGQLQETFEKLSEGEIEYLFLSPEQLQKPATIERLQQAKPSLFVVDEAHCVSEWGHDFRPDYMKLGAVIDALGHPRILALTATASSHVRDEIIERLHMRDPKVVVRGFDRPNIYLKVRAFATDREKVEALLDAVEEAEKPGIIYASTRKNAEDINRVLGERGVNALCYHGGMAPKERTTIHNDFMSGNADIIVATNAFGMGVDKQNVRFVFHADISDSIDSYYQEIGRAGRDGAPAEAVLFYRPENINVHKFLKGGGKLLTNDFKAVADLFYQSDDPLTTSQIKDKTGIGPRKLAKLISRLLDVRVIDLIGPDTYGRRSDSPAADEALKQAAALEVKRKSYEQQRIEKVQAFAELLSCRREYILQYFGEEAPLRCEHCDNCCEPQENRAVIERAKVRSSRSKTKILTLPVTTGEFAPKTRVVHKEWGRGLIEHNDSEKLTVLFDEPDVGRKTLSLAFVKENDLLAPVA